MKFAAIQPTQRSLACRTVFLLLLLPTSTWAANGLTLTGFGAESSGMGGVDLAIARDTTALNTNPAGLAQLSAQAMDIYIEPFYAIDNAHEDEYNSHQKIRNRAGAVFGGGYAHAIGNGEFVAGVGLFSQGGIGYVYEDLNTRFGTRDEISAIFGIFKLAPGLAWRVNDQLRLGASIGINYAVAREKIFPDTSVYDPENPDAAFSGLRLDGLRGFGFNGKFGLQYQPTKDVVLGLAYTSEIPLDLDHGRMTVNYEAIGLGRVEYRNASLHGIALPQEFGAGLTYRLSPRWLVGGEYNWLDYSRSMKALTLTAHNPDNPLAPEIPASRQALNFRDVSVFAIGVEHQLNSNTVLRAGFSHANVVAPSQNLSPILPLINENVVSVGFSTALNSQWILGTALEYQPRNEVSYSNPVSPAGPNSKESNHAILLTLMISRRW